MMEFSTNTIPEIQIVPKGGMLFEHYMYTCSSYAQYRKWTSAITQSMENNGVIPDVCQDELIQDNLTVFVGWLLMHIGNIGRKARRQRFYHTHVLQYLGLSRRGVDLLSQLGYGVTLDMYDNMRRDYITASDTKSRYTQNTLKLFI